MSVIDKDGNMFDTTSSGGWISGCVILGNTGIAMSSRGEQFFLDEKRANHAGAAGAAALHADAQPRPEGRQAVHGHRHAGRRQPGADDPAGVPRRRRVLGRLVSEPAHGVSPGPASRRCTSTDR